MDRLARVLIVSLLVCAAGFVLFGGIPGSAEVGPVVLVVPLAVVGVGALLFRRGGGGADLAWAGQRHTNQVGTVPAPMAGAVITPSVEPRPSATPRQISRALARAEQREWLSSGWFATGVGFCVLQVVLFGWVFAYDNDGAGRAWSHWIVLYPIMAHPMVGMAVVGAHQAVTRGRRDGVEELFEACPTGEATRTAAHLRCAWVPAAALAVFVAVMTLVAPIESDGMYGSIGGRELADCLAAVVLGACGTWLGVALGRWAPWRLVPVVFVIALVPVIVGLGALGAPHWSNLRQLSSWPRYPDHDLLFTDRPVWWHLVWLAALGGLMAVVAFLHADRSRRVVVTAAVLVVVAAVAGVGQTRPLSDGAAARLASLVAQPERNQTCRSAGRVEVCAYRGYEGYLEVALPNVAPVAAALPESTHRIILRQVFDGDLDVLGPEVGRALSHLPAPAGDFVSLGHDMGYETGDDEMATVRLVTALAAVGLPAQAPPDDVPTVISGQARGVVALWLATRGLDAADARDLASDHYNPDDDLPDGIPTPLDLGMAWPDPCSAGPPPVAWSAQDLAGARALIALPEDQVHDLLMGDWNHFTDPSTTTDELLRAAGLEPVGPPDRVVAVALRCPY